MLQQVFRTQDEETAIGLVQAPGPYEVKSVTSVPSSDSRSMQPSRLDEVGWSSITMGAPLSWLLSTKTLTS